MNFSLSTYEISDVYQCQRAALRRKTKKKNPLLQCLGSAQYIRIPFSCGRGANADNWKLKDKWLRNMMSRDCTGWFSWQISFKKWISRVWWKQLHLERFLSTKHLICLQFRGVFVSPICGLSISVQDIWGLPKHQWSSITEVEFYHSSQELPKRVPK